MSEQHAPPQLFFKLVPIMPQSKCNTGTDLPLSSVWDINTRVYGEPDHVKQCARGLKKQRHLSQMWFFLKDRSYKTSLCQSNDSSDINTQSNMLLVCIAVILSGLSYSNVCFLAFSCITRRSLVCQHFRNPNSDWGYTVLHTCIPEGAQWGWKQEVVTFTPACVRTEIDPHQGQWQQMWQDKIKNEKGEV